MHPGKMVGILSGAAGIILCLCGLGVSGFSFILMAIISYLCGMEESG